MAYINGIVTKPVATQDVAKALGRSSSKIGVLCTMDNINKWAKYKPVKYDKVTVLTEAERVSVHYGITNIPFFSALSNMAMYMFHGSPNPDSGAKTAYWTYDKPGKGDWARLGDFDGYYHAAKEMIEPIERDTINAFSSDDNIIFDFPIANHEKNLKISDFDWSRLGNGNPGVDCYVGLCITDGVGKGSSNMNDYTGTRVITLGSPIKNVSGSVLRFSVPRAELTKLPSGKQFEVFAFVSIRTISQFSQLNVAGLNNTMCIPFTMSGKKVTIVTAKQWYVEFGGVTVRSSGGGGSTGPYRANVSISINVTNQGLVAKTFGGGSVTTTFGTNTTNQGGFPSTTVQPGATATLTKTFTIDRAGNYSFAISIYISDDETTYTYESSFYAQ
ncbi:MAG: hypothetical protein HDT01_03065 [Bacteroidales bacterium]|nr:hypothetical protein [Bacteroidales bacterium]